jgi:large subunit ribosomal protein L3
MSGHLGSVKRTTQNLEVLRVDVERGLLLIKGAIPGSKGGDVVVHPSVKISKIVTKPVKVDAKAAAKSGTKSGKKAGA